jgi:hypothetical protein
VKKCFVLIFTVLMIGAFTATASAGALGVNVPSGYVLEADSVFTPGGNDFAPAFIAGLNGKVALGIMFDTSVSVKSPPPMKI